MSTIVIIANIIGLMAGICSVLSVRGKTKKEIVSMEFFATILRLVCNSMVKNWSDVISKIIKFISQLCVLKNKFTKTMFLVMSLLYMVLCLTVTF